MAPPTTKPPRIYCCSNGCVNSSIRKPELSFFKLPKEADRRQQWLEVLCREDLVSRKAKSYVVCEEHFPAHEVLRSEQRKNLKKNVVPSRNLPGRETDAKVVAFDVTLNTECGTQTEPDSKSAQKRNAVVRRKRKLKLKQLKRTKRIKLEELDQQTEKQQKDIFHNLCDKYLTSEFSQLIKTQTLTDPKARKQYLSITTEIDEKIISILKTKVENMTDNEKICCVIVDAMDLSANVVYNTKQDKFIGFHEIAGVQVADPASMALVMMLRGIVEDWQQPIGFALLSEYRDYEGTTKWIDKLTGRLCDIGLDVRAVVSSMEPDLYNLAKERTIYPEKPFFSLLRSRKTFYIFDASSLLLKVRDSLLENEFHFLGNVASMNHVKQFYELDTKKVCSLTPKLTRSHVYPSGDEKKDVRLAAQLLSNSVAAAILTYIDFYVIDECGRDTVKVVKIINELHDLLNSTKLENDNVYKRAFTGDPAQVQLINDAINLFRTLKLVDKRTGSDVTKSPSGQFIEGFQISIGSIVLLLEDLRKKNIKHLQTKRLSTDATKKLFREIKASSGRPGDPTSRQFVSAFRELFIKYLMKPPKGKDCSFEIAKLLTVNSTPDDVNDGEEPNDNITFVVGKTENVKVKSSEYNQIEIPDNNTLVHLSSFLLKRCSGKHKNCKVLQSYIATTLEQRIRNFEGDARYQRYREYSKETSSSLLTIPDDDFVKFVEQMDEGFRSNFKKKMIDKDVASTIYSEIKTLKFSLPCPCFPIVYLMKLFIRMRIFHCVQFNNAKWRNIVARKKFFTVPSLFKAWVVMCGDSEKQQGNVVSENIHKYEIDVEAEPSLQTKSNPNIVLEPHDQIPKEIRNNQTTNDFDVSSDTVVGLAGGPSTCKKRVTKGKNSNSGHKLKRSHDSNAKLRPKLLRLTGVKNALKKLLKDKERGKQFLMHALMLYLKSPASYKVLRDVLSLPTVKQLSRINLDISPSMSTHVISNLQHKIHSLKNNNRHCTVSLKKMSLKKFLFYHINNDKVIGFQNIDGIEEMKPATEVYVLLARGLKAKWEQLVGYCFVNEDEGKSNFDPWLSKILGTLVSIGYAVVALVVDHEDLFTYVKQRLISVTHPQIRINNQRFPIYCIFDLSQLIISLRNMLMRHTLQFHDDDGSLVIADWEILKKIYSGTKDNKPWVILPKLSKSHIWPNDSEKKELKYAAEVFSKSVSDALEMLCKYHEEDKTRIRGTQKLTILVNDVLDILNSSSLNHHNRCKSSFTGEPHQMKAIKNFMEFLTHVRPVEEVPANDPVLDCLFGLRISLMSMSVILRDLLPKGIKALITHRFNLEALDRFLESTKLHSKSEKPTSVEFYKTFKNAFIVQLMTPPRTDVPNDNLVDFIKMINQRKRQQKLKSHDFVKTIVVETTDYRFELPKSDSFHYVCWYLFKKCYEVHSTTPCELVMPLLQASVTSVNWATYKWDTYFKPPQVFISFIETLDELFDLHFGYKMSVGLGTGLLMVLKDNHFKAICPCFPVTYLRKLYVRLRIFHLIRYNNRRFCEKSYKFSKTDYYNVTVL